MTRNERNATARVYRSEVRRNEIGDYGGAYYVCIDGLAMGTGYNLQAKELADEIARRWNAALPSDNTDQHNK